MRVPCETELLMLHQEYEKLKADSKAALTAAREQALADRAFQSENARLKAENARLREEKRVRWREDDVPDGTEVLARFRVEDSADFYSVYIATGDNGFGYFRKYITGWLPLSDLLALIAEPEGEVLEALELLRQGREYADKVREQTEVVTKIPVEDQMRRLKDPTTTGKE